MYLLRFSDFFLDVAGVDTTVTTELFDSQFVGLGRAFDRVVK